MQYNIVCFNTLIQFVKHFNVKLCLLVQEPVHPTVSTSQSFAQCCPRGQHTHILIQQELLCRDLLSLLGKQVATWTETFCFSYIMACLYLSGGHFKAGECRLNDGRTNPWLRVTFSRTPSARLSGLQLTDALAKWTI